MKTRREESIVARRFSGFVDLRMYQNMFLGMTTFVTVFFFFFERNVILEK